MVVTRQEFTRVLAILMAEPGRRSIDTETTGLRPFHGDELFSLIIGDFDGVEYYFNFGGTHGQGDEYTLPREWLCEFTPFFSEPNNIFYMHNGKFDLHMLAREGLAIQGVIHCTLAQARVLENDHMSYGLDACAKRIGIEKSDAVEKWINEQKAYTWVTPPGSKKKIKKPDYTRVPWEIITAYGEQDARVTRSLGQHQELQIRAIDQGSAVNAPKLSAVMRNEQRLTPTLFRMEQIGIKIDRDYCERAANHEMSRYFATAQEFERLAGTPFKDSNKAFAGAFTKLGEAYPTTEKGNPSFTDSVLEGFTSPLAKLIQDHREAYKKCNTYYRNFLYHADSGDIVHANIRQGGTGTGRLSYADPNLQNLNKEENLDEPYLVRRAFVPRPGYFFFMIDYDQMEYRMMLDLAAQLDIIYQVKKGVDVHQAMADLLSVTRTVAKTINFSILYGAGAALLASRLGKTVEETKQIKADYFRKLPQVEHLIRSVSRTAEARGYIFNWLGRRSYFKDKTFAYKAPNYLIQGGCGDVVKVAMNQIDQYLLGKKTKMLVQVHDELVFEGHESEMSVIGDIVGMMEQAYPHKYLPLTCSVSHSFQSWADKVDGMPS